MSRGSDVQYIYKPVTAGQLYAARRFAQRAQSRRARTLR